VLPVGPVTSLLFPVCQPSVIDLQSICNRSAIDPREERPALSTILPTPLPLDRLDHDLTPAELSALADGLAADRGVHEQAATLQPGPGARGWMLLHRDDHVDVWLIAWGQGADTGWHDHDRSAGAFAVAEGEIVEARPSLRGRHRRRRHQAGAAVSFGPEHVHRVRGAATRSVTVHAYSPPLSRMGRYTVAADGTLRRHSVGADDELEIG
jgi:predicted metal-dependent enzyme (double-stranded beta helix superfamily)